MVNGKKTNKTDMVLRLGQMVLNMTGTYVDGKKHGEGEFIWADGSDTLDSLTITTFMELEYTSGQMVESMMVNG